MTPELSIMNDDTMSGFEYRAMRHFNQRGEFFTHVVDGGKFGGVLVLVWQSHTRGWTATWKEVEKITP